MGKKAELILSRMIRARRVRMESIDRVMNAIKNAPGEDFAYLDLVERQDLLDYIGAMQDTMEALEQEVEEVTAVTGEARLSDLITENLELKDYVSNLEHLLESAELYLGSVGPLMNELFDIVISGRPASSETRIWAEKKKRESGLRVEYDRGGDKPFLLMVGGHILNMFATSEEAEKALKELDLF